MAKERFYEIDLFRFIAAISVVLYHYTFRGYAADDMSILSFPLLGQYFKYGYLGVEFFFIISGFVILLTLLNKDLIGFVISRITRLYPAFWLGVTLTAITTLVIGGSRYHVGLFQYLANLSMISGFFNIEHVDGVYWTLLIEIKFYFLAALLLLFKQTKNVTFYLFLWLLLDIFNLFMQLPFVLRFFLFPEWSSYFIAGAFFYLIRKNGVTISYLLGIAVSYSLSIQHSYTTAITNSAHYQETFSPVVVISITTLFYTLMLLVSLRKTGLLNKPLMLHLGLITYPIYLIHQNIGFMFFNYFGNNDNKYLLLLFMISLMIFLSYLIGAYYERKVAIKLKALLLSGLKHLSFIPIKHSS